MEYINTQEQNQEESRPTENLSAPLNSNQQNFPKKRFNKRWLLIGFIIVVILVIGFPYLFSLIYYSPYILEQITRKSPSAVMETTISPEEISNWKTFEGKYVGLSFKYPSNWHEVDSESVSQVPVKDVYNDNLDAYREGKIANLINVQKFSNEIDNTSYDKVLKYYENLRSAKLNKEIVDLEYEDQNIKKIKEGKVLSGQDFITFISYSDYIDEKENKNDIYLITYIKDKDAFYKLTLSYRDSQGENIFYDIVRNSKITNNPLPDRL